MNDLVLSQADKLSSDRAAAIVFGIAIRQRKMAFVGVPFPSDELRRLWGDIFVRRLCQFRNSCADVLIGHFQRVAAAARHFLFLSSVSF